MFTHHFHQPWQQVGDSVGAYGLTEGSEHLEGAPGVVTRRTAHGRLQGHVTELLLQAEIWQMKWKWRSTMEECMCVFVCESVCALPDLDSLKTNTTCRRKFVSCPVLFKVWFFGVMSSWHHSGPYVLQTLQFDKKNILSHTWSTTRW